MIRTYRLEQDRCRQEEDRAALTAALDAAWIDLNDPTREEERTVEEVTGVQVPTKDEMAEIEASSRLYHDGQAAVMTAPLLVVSRSPHPETTDVTFVLTPRHLVTVRYAESTAFTVFAQTAQRTPVVCASPQAAFAKLLDAIVDRLADVLEDTGRAFDEISRAALTETATRRDLRREMRRLGLAGEVVSKARESLVGLSRLVGFARQLETIRQDAAAVQALRAVAHDMETLTEHAAFLSGRTAFLLDAMLGLINIEQNQIIKIFSVVAVMFLPPTLIASIYGMNFAHMPELSWWFGYPLALGAMVVSMIVPYLFFKRQGWI